MQNRVLALQHPVLHGLVELVTTTYQTGVKLTKEAMDTMETQLQRLPSGIVNYS